METKSVSNQETIPIKKLVGVEVRDPKWDNHPERSKTNNQEYRKCLFVIFEDYEGNQFDWMPRWHELDLINKEKIKIENLNKDLYAKKNVTD